MESLRQGQGIIDIVNGYLYTALFNGVRRPGAPGVGVPRLARARGFVACWRVRSVDADAGRMGAALLACMVATLALHRHRGIRADDYILCGLLVSYAAGLGPAPIGDA